MTVVKIRVDREPGSRDEWEPPYEEHEVVFANEFIIATTYECCFALWTGDHKNHGRMVSTAPMMKDSSISYEEVKRFYLGAGCLPFVGEFDRTFWEHLDKRAAERRCPASSARASRTL